MENFSITLTWKDERYIDANVKRETECKANNVVWRESSQFWVPELFVWHALELVSP